MESTFLVYLQQKRCKVNENGLQIRNKGLFGVTENNHSAFNRIIFVNLFKKLDSKAIVP